MKAQAAAPTQLDPSLLDSGDYWSWCCPYAGRDGCTEATLLQGGRPGVRAHTLTVHGKEAPPL